MINVTTSREKRGGKKSKPKTMEQNRDGNDASSHNFHIMGKGKTRMMLNEEMKRKRSDDDTRRRMMMKRGSSSKKERNEVEEGEYTVRPLGTGGCQ